MKGWVKAGLVCAVLSIVLTLPAFTAFYLPLGLGMIISLISSVIFLLLYPGVGALAVLWSTPPLSTKQAAIDGAWAGLLTFLLNGVATMLIFFIVETAGGLEEFFRANLPPLPTGMLEPLTTYMYLFLTIMICINLPIGVAAGALGGFVTASLKRSGS